MNDQNFCVEDGLFEYKCNNCLNIENDLINVVKGSNEYKRSLAISDAINLLLDKIEKVEKDKIKFKMSLEQKENLLDKMDKEVQLLNSKIKMERKEKDINEDQFRKKFEDFTVINLSLEEKIQKLENFYKMKDKEKSLNIQNILSEYKNTFQSLENEIKKLNSEMIDAENLHKKKIAEIEKSHKNEIETYSSKEFNQNKKLKDYEILFHKLDLENQVYRESLRELNKKINSNSKDKDLMNVFLPKKIDLMNEITFIENSQDKIKNNESPTKKLNISRNNNNETDFPKEENFNNLNPNKNFSIVFNTEESIKTFKCLNEMNIEEITEEIRKTENIIKNYSMCLKSQEDSMNRSNAIHKEEEFKECMSILEDKAEYLIKLKKRYNLLYKQINNLI